MRLIKNGQVLIDNRVEKKDILIDEGKIIQIDDSISKDCEVIDASGLTVIPGLVDVHVHFREPGHSEKETIHTGSLAAAHGGFPRQAHRLHAARHLRRARPQQARSDRLRLPGYSGAGRQFQPQAVFQRPLGLCRRGLPPRVLADAAGPPELCIYQ